MIELNSNQYSLNSNISNKQGTGLASLDQGDFLRIMTEQIKMQDPFDPVDNKDMLAQMAQFSSLSGISEINETLKYMSKKFDLIMNDKDQ